MRTTRYRARRVRWPVHGKLTDENVGRGNAPMSNQASREAIFNLSGDGLRRGVRLHLPLLAFMLWGCGHSEEGSGVPVRQMQQAFTNTEEGCVAKTRAITATSGQVIVQGSGLVDAYDSTVGSYGGSNILAEGAVQAATGIVVNGGTINGQKIPNTPSLLEPATVPAGVISLPLGATAPGNLNINGLADSVTLTPGNYVVQDLNVNFSGRINIAPEGEVNIYVLGSLNLGGIENPGGSPENLTLFVQSSGYVNVNSNGQLFGSIYAPDAIVQINSQVFGSVVGSNVTVNSGGAVHRDQTLGCFETAQPPDVVRPPRTLPPPPTKVGCYLGSPNGWREVACSTDEQVTVEYPVPYPAIESYADETPSVTPLEYGEIDVTFSAIGRVDRTEFSDTTRDELSFQANTNYFARPGGLEGWVQFVLQTKPTLALDPMEPRGVAICIWDFLHTGIPSSSPLDFRTTCVGNLSGGSNSNFDPYTARRRPGHFEQFDFATVAGTVFVASGEGAEDCAHTNDRKLGMVAKISWFDPNNDPENDRGMYAVVKCDESGLAGNWTAISGGVFGHGGGSDAYFQDTMVVNRILAGSCANAAGPSPTIPWPGACPDQLPLLPNTRLGDARLDRALGPTFEDSNLELLGPPLTLAASSPDLVYTTYYQTSEVVGGVPICLEGAKRIYVKDHPGDNGFVPSNIDGQPFWNSPDLFIVPQGSPVDADAPAPPIVVTPGQTYDAYMRVHNEYSCEAITGVRARLHIADPAALSVAWGEITPGTDYVGPPGQTAGVTVPAGGSALLGPFTFQAPTTGLGDGHRCMLGSLISDEQSTPSDPFDAPGSHQVAQRNVAFEECSFPLTNAMNGGALVRLTLSADGAEPALSGSNDFSWTFYDPTQDWYQDWLAGAGTTYSVTHNSGETTVRLGPPQGTIWMGQTSVTLPPVSLAAGVTIAATAEVGLGAGEVDTILSIQGEMLDLYGFPITTNGGSCVGRAPAPPNCGDGNLDSDEECDDGGLQPGDGCDDRCDAEPFCGDGSVDSGEQCDAGNADNTDGCLQNCVIATGAGPFYEQDGLVVIEAENYDASRADSMFSDAWSEVSVAGASDGLCMMVGPDSANQVHTATAEAQSSSARLDYEVEFVNTGTWYVWVRGASPVAQGYAGNSCFVGVDDVPTVAITDFPDNGTYAWRVGTVSVSSAGQHSINVFMREDGFFVDKIILTNNAGYTPTGIAQVESPRL